MNAPIRDAARGRAAAFSYVTPAKQRASQYEELTLHIHWHPDNFAVQGWFNRDRNGAPPWRADATALRASDWWAYRDPEAEWFRPFTDRQAAIGRAIAHAVAGARRSGAFRAIDPDWLGFLAGPFAAWRFLEYGLFLALCYAQRECASDVVAAPLVFQSLEKDRHAQDIALYCMEIEECVPGFGDAGCKALWMDAPEWQPLRRLVEYLLACRDWGEIGLVVNLLVETLVAPLFTRELVLRNAPRRGDFVTPVVVAGAEADRAIRRAGTRALVAMLLAQEPANAATVRGWLDRWTPLAREAAAALAPLFAGMHTGFDAAFAAAEAEHDALIADLGLAPLERAVA